MNNYFVSENFSKYIEEFKENKSHVERLEFVFGNMFWGKNFKPENENKTFFLNHWKLDWLENPGSKNKYYLDYYSIHPIKIFEILNKIESINFEDYFKQTQVIAKLNQDRDILHRQIITEWIEMYRDAINKNKGIVYDIG